MIELDLQDAMDTVVKHLLDGGKQCVDADGNCQYDNGVGNACFIGLNIKDRSIAATWDQESLSAIDLILNNKITLQLAENTKGMEASILQDFQDLHDNFDNWADGGHGNFAGWKELVEFAEDHGLEVPKGALEKL